MSDPRLADERRRCATGDQPAASRAHHDSETASERTSIREHVGRVPDLDAPSADRRERDVVVADGPGRREKPGRQTTRRVSSLCLASRARMTAAHMVEMTLRPGPADEGQLGTSGRSLERAEAAGAPRSSTSSSTCTSGENIEVGQLVVPTLRGGGNSSTDLVAQHDDEADGARDVLEQPVARAGRVAGPGDDLRGRGMPRLSVTRPCRGELIRGRRQARAGGRTWVSAPREVAMTSLAWAESERVTTTLVGMAGGGRMGRDVVGGVGAFAAG